MRPHPLIPNSIWTSPRLNRETCFRRRQVRQEVQEYKGMAEEVDRANREMQFRMEAMRLLEPETEQRVVVQ